MTNASRRIAGILFVALPIVMWGGYVLLDSLIRDPAYLANPLRQDMWRAGHAHAGVWLVLSLIALRYVDEAKLPKGWKAFARSSIPIAAILVPAGFFLSVASPNATSPNALIWLVYVGAALIAAGVLTLGVGLLRRWQDN